MVMYAPGMLKNRDYNFPDKGLRYHFLGGGNEVGNVGCLLDDDKENRLLLDYGIAPTDPPKYPLPSPSVKHSIITHSHIDHLGMAPWLCANHRTKLHGTSITANISELMWNDCYKVSKIEGYPLPWDKRDIDTSIDSWEIHDFNQPWMQNEWKLTLQNAGHIPGASMLSVETDHGKVIFTGDFDSRDSMLVEGAKPEKTDILFIEGTYGGRNHPNQEEERRRFCEEIVRVSDRGGTVLIPAFANGRTQDIVMMLHKYLPELNVHVDGMGKRIAKIYMDHPDVLKDPDLLKSSWKWSKQVSSKSDRKKALDADCIVSTSGMLDGGPSIWYLNRLKEDRRNAIFFTGYQAKGSGGRSLLETGKVPIWKQKVPINLDVKQFSFSTHAGHDEIVQFSSDCDAEKIVIYHSDPNHSRPPLAEALEKNGHQVDTPENGKFGNLFN